MRVVQLVVLAVVLVQAFSRPVGSLLEHAVEVSDSDKKTEDQSCAVEAKPAGINWHYVNSKLPFERTPADQAKRHALFSSIDNNGNGFLSLAEVDKGIRDNMQLDAVFDCKPVIMRAFQAAKNVGGDTSGLGVDYIERKEFRMLLQYLRSYFELYQMFSLVDINDDRRINMQEFTSSIPSLHQWGLQIEPSAAGDVFKQIDVDGGGMILFVEFADWAIKMKLDLGEEENVRIMGPTITQAFAPHAAYALPQTYSAAPAYSAAPMTTYAAAPAYSAPPMTTYAAAPAYSAPMSAYSAAPVSTYAAAPMSTYAAAPAYSAPQFMYR